MTYPKQSLQLAADLASDGLSDYAIAAQTGFARSTVQRWRRRGWATRERDLPPWCEPDPDRYCDLLGCYLGDGHVPKHLRTIALVDWQEELTTLNPRAVIRGLIHSDGCRVINRFRTRLPSGNVREYAYPRYFFSNLSADIRAIFGRHCALLGIRVTQSNHRNLTVSHRDSVAILDTFIGPKA